MLPVFLLRDPKINFYLDQNCTMHKEIWLCRNNLDLEAGKDKPECKSCRHFPSHKDRKNLSI